MRHATTTSLASVAFIAVCVVAVAAQDLPTVDTRPFGRTCLSQPHPQPEAPPSSKRDRLGLSVRTYGGWRQLQGGDINDAVATLAGVLEAGVAQRASTLAGGGGNVAALRRGSEYGADVIVHVTPRIGLVGGVGWTKSTSEGVLDTLPARQWYAEGPLLSQRTTLLVRAVPVRFGVQYAYPVGRRVGVVLEGGGGLYFTRLRWSHQLAGNRSNTWRLADTSGHGVGVHGGVWADIGFTDRFGLLFGAQWTHANVGGLVGYREGNLFQLINYDDRLQTREEGTLRLARSFQDGTEFLIVGDGTWMEEAFGPLIYVRDASVGLGGLRITSGLRIGF